MVTASGTTATDYPFSISVSASALDLSGKEAASANISASFSSSLTGANGQPLDMEGLGITVVPAPIPDKNPDHTGPDEHTPKCDSEGKGMATYNFHTMLASLKISDTPVGYDPPYGHPVPFTVTYTQREASQPAVFNFTNLGPKWNINWLSYIIDNPADFKAVSGQARAGGGKLTAEYSATSGGKHTYKLVGRPSMQLQRPVASPLPYEITHPDGSKEIFGQPDGTTSGQRRVFLTQRIDPAGNVTTIGYDAQMRLTSITDALGQQTILTYGRPGDPFKVTRVTDPFGRFASFDYDAAGRLRKITDVIGIESIFTYEGTGDFINSLTTPYGTTTFTNTQNGSIRRITATDPAGDTEVLEANLEATAGVPARDASGMVPAGMTVFNSQLNLRNSFYWDKKQWKEAPNDYSKAHIYHWLLDTNYTSMSGVLESEKPPLQNRIWYSYPGQTMSQRVGDGRIPSKTGRVIEGGTQLVTHGITPVDRISSMTDPVGRETRFEYNESGTVPGAMTGFDLTAIKVKNGAGYDTLATLSDFEFRKPRTVTDAAGQITRYVYNAFGQISTATNARNEVTTFTYYPADAAGKRRKGRLQQIDGALAGSSDVVTLDYDSAGRVARITGPDGYYLDYAYDNLDRLTRTTYPDATYTETIYQRLDPFTYRDRLGRLTTYAFNEIRQLASVTDPANRKIQYRWCKCGDLAQLIDAMGRLTRWRHDVAGRVTAKEYCDGSKIAYTYQPLSGRLSTTTDEKLQVKTHSYYLDDSLAGIAYTNEQHATPDVTFTYDPVYRRLREMVDGIGTTRYTYHPNAPGILGAGQLATIDTPLPNDTLAYTYDQLSRRTGYTINGVGESRAYDALGRTQTVTNPLGSFGYTYHGATERVDTVTYPTGMTAAYTWHPLLKDFRLKDIIHTLPGNQLLSRHSYEHDAVGNIKRWTQIAPASGLNRSWKIGYDAADQLTSVASQDPATLALQSTGQYGYSYDDAGNRLTETIDGVTTTAVHNALNQLVSLSKSDSSSALPAQTYEWDAENRLRAVNYTGTAKRSEFTYDGLGRRHQSIERDGAAITSQTSFVWKGMRLGEERDATGNTVDARYLSHGIMSLRSNLPSAPKIGGLFALYSAEDHLGSIRQLVSSSNTLSSATAYDPWGRLSVLSTAQRDSNAGYTGHWFHAQTETHWPFYRQYQPIKAGWLSRDPIEEGGGFNLYGYVSADPISKIDPLGLAEYDLDWFLDNAYEQCMTKEEVQAEAECMLECIRVSANEADPVNFVSRKAVESTRWGKRILTGEQYYDAYESGDPYDYLGGLGEFFKCTRVCFK